VTRTLQRLAAAAALLCLMTSRVAADTWPRFRGPNGNGQAEAPGIPTQFTEADYAWQTPLAGLGHSSPVIWEDRIFVTSGNPETAELSVMCFDLATGEEQWQRRFAGATHSLHRVNSYATATPAVDADLVYFAWKVGDTVKLAALTHDGHDVWQRDVGHLAENHGFGASPMVVGDVVCITNDTEVAADSSMYGVNRLTSDILWRTPCGVGKTSYATPVVWEAPDGRTLILMGTMGKGLTAYDPSTGEVAWNALDRDLPDRCVSSPILAGDMVIVACGANNQGKQLLGAKLTSAQEPAQEAYRLTTAVPNVPTPVVVDDTVILWHDKGIVSCIDATTGELHYRERIGGNFHASPLRIGDRIFNISLSGEVWVLAAGTEFKELGRSQLNEGVVATPAVADGRMVIRTEQSLIGLGGEK
jgi:outer membrane protein assembly factor BamB